MSQFRGGKIPILPYLVGSSARSETYRHETGKLRHYPKFAKMDNGPIDADQQPRVPMNIMQTEDENHLRTLSICYYLLGSLSLLFGCCPLGYVILGGALIAGVVDDGNPPPPELGIFIAVVGIVSTLIIWTGSLLEFLAARSLGRHSNYRFCFVIACIELINIPLGTILAIFTIVVLSRPSVVELYEGIPHRDRRLAAFDDMDEEDEAPPRPAKGPDDGSIREGDVP